MNETIIKEPGIKEEKAIIKKDIKNKLQYIWHILLIVISLLLLFLAMKQFAGASKEEVFRNEELTITTLVVWICQYSVLKGITGKSKLSLGLAIGIEVAYDIINYIIRIVRGSAITISDIVAIKTGLSVIKNINLRFEIQFLYAILFVLAIVAILIIFRKKIIQKEEGWVTRVIKIITGIAIVFILSKTNIYNGYSLWDINEDYRTLGTPITILRMLHNFKVEPPEGYEKSEVEKLLGSYETEAENEEEDKPNIIVIVNESFSDYYSLYKEGKANPIEYFTELSKEENVISGVMYSSEFGGQTSNVEYEFLTQNSNKVIPIGSYVFQQYITKDVNTSIVQNLKSQGYKTSAIHPWENYAYSRNKVYKLFGFDTIKFKDDIEGLEENFNNDFYTDRSTYNELMRQIKDKEDGEKLFSYVLTVQNHIGYDNPDPNQITYSDDYKTNIYMQLTHESSEALKEVIEELKQSDEKYILLFFGDHQPNLDYTENNTERPLEKYQVPFIIWANYDIEERYDVQTSTVYLQNYLLNAAGVNKSAMNNFMEELQKYYPVITKRFYMDLEGNLYKNNDNISENYEKIEEYDKVSYYNLFDNN